MPGAPPGRRAVSGDGFEVDALDVAVYEIPTEQPEADGTLEWDSTVVVVVEPRLRNGVRGVGHAWGHGSMKPLIDGKLAPEVVGRDVRDVGGAWEAMVRSIRNLGRHLRGELAVDQRLHRPV